MDALTSVDTNIWIYAHDHDEPEKREAALRFLRGLPNPVVSARVMNEFHAIALRKPTPALDDADVHAILADLAAFQVQPITAELVLEASALRTRHSLSPWDALTLAAARAAGCSTLASEDLQEGVTIDGSPSSTPSPAWPEASPVSSPAEGWQSGRMQRS